MSKYRTRRTMWNRLLSGVLCLALALGLLPTAGLIQPAGAASWADPYAEQLVEWGVMTPSMATNLGSAITRAEFVAMCNRAFGYTRLGQNPFVDVSVKDWYYEDIVIAYNAGYFTGDSSDPARPTASPNGPLTREMAAVAVARNLMLQETVGESLGFTDSRDLSDWSRGLIATAVAEGVITGYDDGSFRPFTNITRGEVAALLVRLIGTPISTSGNHELGSVYGNVVISSSDVMLRNTTIVGNLYITGGVDLGNVLLENVTVLGEIVISGGGVSDAAQSSVILRNVEANGMLIDSLVDQFVTISAYGLTDIPLTSVRTDTYLDDSSEPGYGLHLIELAGKSGTKLQLAGSIKEVVNKTPFSDLQLVQGTAEKITIDEYATNSTLLIDEGTCVDELNLDVATLVTGKGDIGNLNIAAEGCEVDILPGSVTIRPGITASVAGEVMGSVAASEMSSEPRLLAGYPAVLNIAPTTAEGHFAVNKPGTVYWAISEIADGSVSEKDLISNPAYGGNIFAGQAGSITAGTQNVYVQQIAELEPDGDYYISAIMVDGRGKQSPLKVVSFTTPDDTVPAFATAPYMSKVSCEVAQVTGMANKSCLLYWVLLPAGAAAPTARSLKSGSVGGNYGYGSQSVVKNVPFSIKVNSTRLQEDTAYDLYLWLTDFNGANSSDVILVQSPSPSFVTPDETPPVVIKVEQTGYGESTAEVTFAINEVPSTLYWAVVTEANESFVPEDYDPNDQKIQIKVENGQKAGAIVSGSMAAGGESLDTIISNITGLLYATYKTHSFKFWYVAKDAAGNYSAVNYIIIQTLDTDPPHAWLEFSNPVNGKPQANSDIRIVFDEQVQGGSGTNARKFLELYEAIETGGDDARNTMAVELAKYIRLYYDSRQVTATEGTGDWINLANAIITMEQGKLVITLPGTTREEDGVYYEQAINLQSGASYQFRLQNVFDTAFTPNGLAVDENDNISCVPEGGKASDNGNGWLYFATAYAQVTLEDKTNAVTAIHYQDYDADTPGKDYEYEGIRIDICLDLVPGATDKVPLAEVWDLIMWSDNIMRVDVYRKILEDDNGNDGDTVKDWEKVNGTLIRFNSSGEGRGLGAYKAQVSFDAVNGDNYEVSLKQGYRYRYGIHITYLEVEEEDPKQTPPDWNELVTMRFSVIAGQENPVNVVSRGVDTYYDSYKARTTNGITEIGVWETDMTQKSILECEQTFVDSRAPSFRSAYPTFTANSNEITMTVSLNRKGTIYYTVAPAETDRGKGLDSIDTEINSSTPINSSNDGRDFDSHADNTRKGEIDGLADNTYIPLKGSERTTYGNKIYFVNDGSKEDPSEYVPGEYGNPDYLSIKNATYRNLSGVKTGSYEVTAGGSIEQIPVGDLAADTWYYVYIVLEGIGEPDYAVQIYRVKTEKASPPVVTISRSNTTTNTGATNIIMSLQTYNGTANDDGTRSPVSSDIYYSLVRTDRLPPYFTNKTYSWDGISATILQAMITRVGGTPTNKTLFDAWADSIPEVAAYKQDIVQYVIEGSGSNYTNYAPQETWSGVFNANSATPVSQNVTSAMPSGSNINVECVLLAVAKPTGAGDDTENYGFAATRGLYWPDPDPPQFRISSTINGKGDGDYLRISGLKAFNSSGAEDEKWGTNSSYTIESTYTFSGTISVQFDKELYQSTVVRDTDGNNTYVTRAVGTKEDDLNETEEVYVLKAINTNIVASKLSVNGNASSDAQQSFSITFEKISAGDYITFVVGSIANRSGTVNTKHLTLTFEPTTRTNTVYPDEGIVEGAAMYMAVFKVDWN